MDSQEVNGVVAGSVGKTSEAKAEGSQSPSKFSFASFLANPKPANLILPPTEDRPHRHLVLPNGLEVILVSDPDCDKAAASMDVGVGHLEDPPNLPGCAHFCEHLMFLGTEKYPDENAYHAFLSANNGHSNAWTATSNTNYFFDVNPDALEGGLDRFAGFFSEPLFAADCTEREIRAVDSEHSKNLQQDLWRFFQLEKHLSRPDHPYSKFGTGNLATLWEQPQKEGRDPRAELIDWWKREYCARRMKLAVLGKDSLDVLEKMVRDRFEKVPVRTRPGQEKHVYSEHVYENMGSWVFVQPVKDTRGLEVSFPMPDQTELYRTKPSNYVGHFLGHEGPGSILSYLKRQGWVNSLRAGLSSGGNGFDFFKVTVDLTPEGLNKYEDVAGVIFNYVRMLQTRPPSEEAFNELKALAEIGFRFAERGPASSYVSDLSGWTQQEIPRDRIVSSQYLVDEWDNNAVQDTLQRLDIRNCRIAVTAKELPLELTKTEPIYGTPYEIKPFSKEFIERATSSEALSGLALPGPNEFIPNNLDVEKTSAKPLEEPVLLRDSPTSRLWYKKDDRFWTPRANLFLAVKSPLLNVSPRTAVLGRLFCDLFRDATTEQVYDAELAGLQFSLEYSGDTITLGTVGYNDKLLLLTKRMLELLKEYRVDESRFELMRDQLRRNWSNFNMEEPYALASYYAHYADSEVMWTPMEKKEELNHITASDVDAFARDLFDRCHLEALVHGNMKRSEAQELVDTVEGIMQPRPLAAAEKVGERSLVLPEGTHHVWQMAVPNPANANNAIEYYVQVGEFTDDYLRPRLSLLSQIAHQPVFDILRTQEQLGYLVFSGTRTSNLLGWRVIVQSARKSSHLESRVEAFFDRFRDHLENMSEEDFTQHRKSLINKKREKPKNLHEESGRFWHIIDDGWYDFERRVADATTLETVTKEEILNLFREKIHYSSSTKLSIHMNSQVAAPKFDPTTAMPFVTKLAERGVEIPQEQLQAMMTMSLGEIKSFAKEALSQMPDSQDLIEMVDQLGGAPNEEVPLRKENIIVDDVVKWKAGLVVGKAATPRRSLRVEESIEKK